MPPSPEIWVFIGGVAFCPEFNDGWSLVEPAQDYGSTEEDVVYPTCVEPEEQVRR
jgi:hypothetical protein